MTQWKSGEKIGLTETGSNNTSSASVQQLVAGARGLTIVGNLLFPANSLYSEVRNRVLTPPGGLILANENLVTLPSRLWFEKVLDGNHIAQLQFPRTELRVDDPLYASLKTGELIQLHGKTVLISKTKRQSAPDGVDDVLWMPEAGKFEWSRKHELSDIKWEQVFSRREEATSTLENKFVLIEEELNTDLTVKRRGLRSPQIGAIHAALAHWRMSSEVATIVLPTGTGKTDCMVALMALRRPKCLLVTVPTDALRKQLAEKFMSLGVLVSNGSLPTSSTYPWSAF